MRRARAPAPPAGARVTAHRVVAAAAARLPEEALADETAHEHEAAVVVERRREARTRGTAPRSRSTRGAPARRAPGGGSPCPRRRARARRSSSSRSAITVSRRSRSVSTSSRSSARSCERPSSRIGRRVSTNRRRRRCSTRSGRSSSARRAARPLAVAARDAAAEQWFVLARRERVLRRVDPGVGRDPDGEVQRVGRGRLRLVQPAAGKVERVPRAEHQVVGPRPVLSERGRVALVLERQLEKRVVELPPLLARDLHDEDVVRVVMDANPCDPRGV